MKFKKNNSLLKIINATFPNNKFFCAIIDNNFVFDDFIFKSDNDIELIFEEKLNFYREKLNQTSSIFISFVIKNVFPNINVSNIDSNKDCFWVEFDNNNNKIDINFLNLKIKSFIATMNSKLTQINKKNFISNKFSVITKKSNFYTLNNYQFSTSKGFFRNFNLIQNIIIDSISGVYFKGNKENKMLKKIIGFSGFSKSDLDISLNKYKSRKFLDHRSINKEVNFFSFNKKIGAGFPIWEENGYIVYRCIRNFIEEFMKKHNYITVKTPILGPLELYKKSGHLYHYSENMFSPINIENQKLVLRPMTCPHHCILFSNKLKSYRELPFRLHEDSYLFRNESSGSLSGLERVRNMCLVDVHIFISKNDIKKEIIKCLSQIIKILRIFKIKIASYCLSLPDFENNKKEYYVDKSAWEKGITILREALDYLKINYVSQKGEAAFYGPKIDIQILTSLKREITLSTIQIDFLSPKNFNLYFINKNNEKEIPILIHLGIIGTYERIISILLEQNNGFLPLWLSPVQIIIIPISDKHHIYSQKILSIFLNANIRARGDFSKKRMSQKILIANKKRINYKIIIGDEEVKAKKISVMDYINNEKNIYNVNAFLEKIIKAIKNKEL